MMLSGITRRVLLASTGLIRAVNRDCSKRLRGSGIGRMVRSRY